MIGIWWILFESSNTSVFPGGTWLMMTLENLLKIVLFQLGVEFLHVLKNEFSYAHAVGIWNFKWLNDNNSKPGGF